MAVATIDKKGTTVNKGKKSPASNDGADGKPKVTETKDAKFKRLAERRVKEILKKVDGLGNLGNRNAYTYTDEQLDKIFGRLEGAVRDCRNKFSKGGEKKDFHISL